MLTTAPHLRVRRPSPTTAEFTVTTRPPTTLSLRLLLVFVFLLRLLLALAVLLVLHATWVLPRPDVPTAGGLNTAIDGAGAGPSGSFHHHTYTYNHTHDGSGATAVYNATSSGSSGNGNSNIGGAEPHAPPVVHHPAAAAAAAAQQDHPHPHRPTTLYTTDWAPYLLSRLHHSPLGRATTTSAAALPPSLLLALGLALLYLATLRIHTTESLLVLRGLGIQTSSTGGSYLASWRAGTRFIPTEKIRDVLINEAFRGFAVRYYLVVVVDGEEDVVVVFPRLLPRRNIVERVWRGCRGCLWEPQEGGGIGGGGRRGEEKGSCG